MAWQHANKTVGGFINIGGVHYEIKNGLIEGEFGPDQLSYLKNDPMWSEVAKVEKEDKPEPAPKKKKAAAKKKS